MKSTFYKLSSMALLMVSAIGCGGGSDGSDDGSSSLFTKAALENHADHVVIPTYELLATRAGEMVARLNTLAGAVNATNLEAARDAWVATRVPWEQSESFLFGPVDVNGYDPAMDTWPLNETDLRQVINGSTPLTADYIATLSDNQKGFHTIEFLIYGEDSNKLPAAFTAREIAYMTASAQNLQDVANNLVNSWNDGVDGQPAFRTTFVTAGEEGNTTYPSLSAAGEEVIQLMVDICDEVADGKIDKPFAARDPNLVESQFSFNSLQDFSDNMRSIENVWLGHAPGQTATEGATPTALMASVDADLDARVKAEIKDAIEAILAIPAPFPTTIQNPAHDDTIKAAIEKIQTLRATLFDDVMPIVKG